MNTILIIILIIVFIWTITFISTWVSSARDRRKERKSFLNPSVLSLKDCRDILHVLNVSGDRVQLNFMELEKYRKGNIEVERLNSVSFINLWYSTSNIPLEFQRLYSVFELKNNNGELKFMPYEGVTYKETQITPTIRHRGKPKLAKAH